MSLTPLSHRLRDAALWPRAFQLTQIGYPLGKTTHTLH
jgi:hypothetical protein